MLLSDTLELLRHGERKKEIMGSFISLIVLLVIVIVLVCMAIYVVPQQQAYVIERFGKFRAVRFAGIHLLVPFVDRIAMKTNMRVSQLNVKLETKTLDNVFVTIAASTQYRVNPDNVAKAYYELRDPQGQLRSYMEDALRSAIPMLTLDDAFAKGVEAGFEDVFVVAKLLGDVAVVLLRLGRGGGKQDGREHRVAVPDLRGFGTANDYAQNRRINGIESLLIGHPAHLLRESVKNG